MRTIKLIEDTPPNYVVRIPEWKDDSPHEQSQTDAPARESPLDG